MPTELEIAEIRAPPVECLRRPEIRIEAAGTVVRVTVTPCITGGQDVPDLLASLSQAERSRGQAERATLQARFHAIPARPARNDVDGPEQGGGSVSARRRSFEDLDALDLGDRHGKIRGIVSGLRIRNTDSVQQDGDLLAGTSPQADIGLDSFGAPLPDIHAHGELEEIVDV